MSETSKGKQKLSTRQKWASIFRVAVISYRAAPVILYLRIVSAVLDALLPLATTYFAAQTTSELAHAYNGQPGAGEAALIYVGLTALLGVITTAWSYVEGYLSRVARYKLESVVNDQLVEKFLTLDFWRYDDKHTADLMDRSRRFSNFFTYVFDSLARIISSVVTLITSIIALVLVSWWLGALLLVAVIPGMIIQYKLSKERVEHWSKNMVNRRKMYAIDGQLTNHRGIAELRLYGLVNHLMNLRQHYRDLDEKDQIAIERRFVGKELLASVVEAVAEVAALIYITFRIIAHAQPIGQFVYVQQIVSRGLGSMRSVVQNFVNIDEDIANLYAYNEFMELPVYTRGEKKLTRTPKSIEMNNVSFQYPQKDEVVLKDITLSVAENEHIAIVGENGAGKSTLIKLLLGLYLPTKGEVRIDGIPTQELILESWHKRVAVLQQSTISFSHATVRETVLLGDVHTPVSKQRYDAALEKSESKDFVAKLPKKDDNYTEPWMEGDDGESGQPLSGGQYQRLDLARNFYRDSQVLILDEPTSAIDALAEARIFKRLLNEKNKTIITISHRLSTVRRADRIYVVEQGRIVEQGTHDELVKTKSAYYRLFESQL